MEELLLMMMMGAVRQTCANRVERQRAKKRRSMVFGEIMKKSCEKQSMTILVDRAE